MPSFVPVHPPRIQASPSGGVAPFIPVLTDKHSKGWPEHEVGRLAVYMPLEDALERRWPSDAHFASYSVPAQPRRLARAEAVLAMADRGGIPMVLAVFDLDAPDHQATEAWADGQLEGIESARRAHPGLFAYRTRGGYRLVWRLGAPVVLRTGDCSARWRLRYQRWCCYLARAFGLVADPSCSDWTRLYRLPHATRGDVGGPEEHPSWGDPRGVGVFDVDVDVAGLEDDIAIANELAPGWRLWGPVGRALREEQVRQGGEGGAARGAPGGLPPIDFFAPAPPGEDRQSRRLGGYARRTLTRAAEELRATPAGAGRNNLLNAKAYSLGRLVGAGLLVRHEVEGVLLEAARGAGLPEEEARATLRSGLEGGLAQPRLPDLPPEPSPTNYIDRTPSHVPSPTGSPREEPEIRGFFSGRERPETAPQGERGANKRVDPWKFNSTDTGNAERLVEQHGEDLRYCHPWQKWLAWDGRRWRVDVTAEVRRRAKETARSIYSEASAVSGNDQAAEMRRKELGAWARRSEARERRSAMIELAQSERCIPVLPEHLDADPWLLNCLNGVLDLRTGRLHPHRRNDLFTKLAPVAYEPEATCPTWLAFLHSIMDGNRELIGFLQRFAGYALTGVIREHVLVICYGTGSNGKSTFLETLISLMGDYAWQAPPDLLMLKSLGAHPTDVAGLFGVRFAACIETASGRRLDEARMKMLTGGDQVTARRMREDFWSFRPTHKLALGTNHRPVVATTDHGTWRRQKLVPFTVTIPTEEQDRLLPEKLRAELNGILRWAVEGCMAWQRQGLGDAEAIREATEAWRDESDVLGGFLATCCELAPRATVSVRELYARFIGYCEATGEDPLRQKPFGQRLAERGFAAMKGTGGVRLWRGLRLVPPKGQLVRQGGGGPWLGGKRVLLHLERCLGRPF
jgi:P4 family phage/plasmid primase-like protien